jgi:uncharacterized RDD family membrane protein YckC
MTRRDALTIRTPEGIEFSLPLAGPISRMLALMIDLAAIGTLGEISQQILAPLKVFGEDVGNAVYIIGYFVISIGYAILTEWLWRGQTLGKRLLGLRVVDARGLRLEPAQVIVRNLMRFIDMLPVLYLVGGIACFVHRHRRRLGDVAAGTAVVKTPKLAAPDLDQLAGSKYNSLRESRHLAARLRQKVPREAAQVALEALIRREQLDPAARLAVFARLAAHFRQLVPYPPDVTEQLSDEQYVRNVAEIVFGSSTQSIIPSIPVR